MNKVIYLDYAATTPVDPRVAEAMSECLTREGTFGNPASKHVYGLAASEQIELAREKIAACIFADASELIFTSGATESINLALKGAAKLYQRKGKHIVTVKTEHKATLDACQHLEKEGYQVTYLTPVASGLIDIQQLQSALREDTILVSVMHVNNEIGIVQDIAAIAELTASRHILFHVDAAQSTGKINLNLKQVPIDLVSLSAHKAYGPKGIGALYLRKKPRVRVEPFIHGGGHEQGMRSGTLPTHQIVGMGKAYELAQKEMQDDYIKIKKWRDLFLQKINSIEGMKLNTDIQRAVPHILNIRFENKIADAILADLPMMATSTASACQGKGTEGSYVLRAMGLTEEQAKSSIRFSFGRFTTEEDILEVTQAINGLFQ